ncbi:MAG TPA: recombinase XerD [Lachnospiraceae bacterium]|jgi:site-specific recombinase XerD|nr:recombinase XerD [Lachnospiraceae bacterium]HCM12164.1 recombinase XerD [Lachnospiraceae bacterium]
MDYFSVFIQMLQAKGLTDNTIRSYKTYIKPYLEYLSSVAVAPENASWQAMRDYLSWIRLERNLSDRTINMIISYLQFFHMYVLHKPWDRTQIPFRKFNVYLPFVPSRKEVLTFISSLEDPKARLAVSILYATGLRLDELCHLKCKDIISSSKKIHVSDSKNHQDRFVPMPDMIWQMILSYYHGLPVEMKPDTWLFTQQRSTCHPMDKQWLQKFILEHRSALGMSDKLTSHSFRHAYATHSYENGMDLLTLKTFLGHKSLNSTAIYVHLAASSLSKTVNPFEQIGGGFLG